MEVGIRKILNPISRCHVTLQMLWWTSTCQEICLTRQAKEIIHARAVEVELQHSSILGLMDSMSDASLRLGLAGSSTQECRKLDPNDIADIH